MSLQLPMTHAAQAAQAAHIAIVGAGPGGLTLARLLHLQGIQCTVFERESDALQRPQGGTLDLHAESGMLALERAGLMGAFKRIARYEDQGVRLFNKRAEVLFDDPGDVTDQRPEVDRTALRALLLDALPEGMVRWSSGLQSLQALPDGRWMLECEGGQNAAKEGPFDLVVGADGAWSRVRPLLSFYQPQYSGLCFLEFGIDDVDASHPALAQLVGHGKLVVESDGKALFVQRNGNAHLRGYAVFRVPLGWMEARFDFGSPAAVRDGLIREFSGFAPELLALFRASNDAFAVRPIHALPVGHHWPHRKGLTLIGDAAHVMSPFGGEGVNNAMLDAAELAEHLANGQGLDAAVSQYEAHMFARVRDSAQGAADGAATLLSHDGEALTVQMYRSHRADIAA